MADSDYYARERAVDVHRRCLASSTAPPACTARLSPAVCPLPPPSSLSLFDLPCTRLAALPPPAPVYLLSSNFRCGAALLLLLLQRDTREIGVWPRVPPERRRAFRTKWRCYVSLALRRARRACSKAARQLGRAARPRALRLRRVRPQQGHMRSGLRRYQVLHRPLRQRMAQCSECVL